MNDSNTTPSLFDEPIDPPCKGVGCPTDAPSPSRMPSGAEGGAGAWGTPDGTWLHADSGLLLPRGTVVTSQAPESVLAELAESSDRRGVQAHALTARKVRRTAAESLALDELCSWLNRYGFDVFFSITFSDEKSKRHGIHTIKRAKEHVLGEFKSFGYLGRLALGIEQTDRGIPHVHGVLHSGSENAARLLGEESPRDGALWRHFHSTCGRCRFELVRDTDEASLYAFKDTFKESQGDDSLYVRLRPLQGSRNATKAHPTEQESIFFTRNAKRRRARAVVDEGGAK